MFSVRNQTPRSKARRSASTPFLIQHRASYTSSSFRSASHNRSLQASILEETPQHRVESYGIALPVLITEALTLADKSIEFTARIDPSGWMWLVGGRKLLIWRYKQSHYGKTTTQCKELTLPPSDLAHNANRVCVIPGANETQQVACIAVSPEGVVRYWPSIAHEAASAEISAELKGEECACVVNFQPHGCILATTTSSLVMISMGSSQTSVSCRPIRPAQGMFAGFSRRMTSFIFGSSTAQASGAPLQALVPGEASSASSERLFYVLSGSHLQKWTMSSNTESLVYQIDVERLFRDYLAQKVWNQDATRLTQLQTWLLDMQLLGDNVAILGAGKNSEVNSTVSYALATLGTSGELHPSSFEKFTVLDHTENSQISQESQFLDFHLLVAEPFRSIVFIYNSFHIYIGSVTATETMDMVDFNSHGDMLLGAGSCDNISLFFSIRYGLVCVISGQRQDASVLDDSGMQESFSEPASGLTVNVSQLKDLTTGDNKLSHLKSAFLLFCQRQQQKAWEIVNELFPEAIEDNDGSVPDLDRLIIQTSQAIIDDYPATDPRWAEVGQPDLGSSTSSIIIQSQMEDKQKAHNLLIKFLKHFGLWNRLTVSPARDSKMLTRLLLCEHAEKLVSALTLRKHQNGTPAEVAIKWVAEARRDPAVSLHLTPQDIFYREASRVHEIISALIEYEDETLTSDLPIKDVVATVSSINSILERMLFEALQYRLLKAAEYESDVERIKLEYTPWTSTVGIKGVRTLLLKQCSITMEHAIMNAQDVHSRGTLFQQLRDLSDIILDGYSSQLESIRTLDDGGQCYEQVLKKYEQERQTLLVQFMDHKQYERAASLAEKYYDFETLVEICELTDNQERMQRYKTQFADRGFSEYLFNWYVTKGKRGKLLAQPQSQHKQLSAFLQEENNRYLSWLHNIETKDYNAAHERLFELAKKETKFLSKKKTLLSLSKLTALASDNPPENLDANIEAIIEEHDLLTHQEQLPADVIEAFGMDPGNMRVLLPHEMIELYICNDNVSATQYDFKKALDLLTFVNENEMHLESLREHIWCQAILRDKWVPVSDDPLESTKDNLFFKIIDLAYNEGCDLIDFLPNLTDILSADELGDLRNDCNFQYLMRAGYEHIQNII